MDSTRDKVELSSDGRFLAISYSYRDKTDSVYKIQTNVMDITDLVTDLESQVSFKVPYEEATQEFFDNMIESYYDPSWVISVSFLDNTHLFVYGPPDSYKILDISEGETTTIDMKPRIVYEKAIIWWDRFNRTYDKPVDPVIKLPYIIYPYDYYLWDGSTIVKGGNSSMDAYIILGKSDIHSNELIEMLLDKHRLKSLLGSFSPILTTDLIDRYKHEAKISQSPDGTRLIFWTADFIGKYTLGYDVIFASYNDNELIPVHFNTISIDPSIDIINYSQFGWINGNQLVTVTTANGDIGVAGIILFNVIELIDAKIRTTKLFAINIDSFIQGEEGEDENLFRPENLIVTDNYIWYHTPGGYHNYTVIYDLIDPTKSLLILSKPVIILHDLIKKNIINDQLVVYPTQDFKIYNIHSMDLLPLNINTNLHSSIIFNLETREIRRLTISFDNIHQIVLAKNKSLMVVTEKDGKVHFFDPKVSHLLIQGITPPTSIITNSQFVELDPVLRTSLKLAEEAQIMLPKVQFAPGGRIFIPRFARTTMAQLAPVQTAQYIPPTYQELYNVCADPTRISKQALLEIGRRMGATNILPTDPEKLNKITNQQICATLINFAQLQQIRTLI